MGFKPLTKCDAQPRGERMGNVWVGISHGYIFDIISMPALNHHDG